MLVRAFPQLLVNTFTQFLVITEDGQWDRLYTDNTDVFNYYVNLGLAISDNNFDNFDNVIIPFFESCYSVQRSGRHNVIFSEEAKNTFIGVCNSFKGQSWDDILDVFCDELLLLAKSAAVNGRHLYGDN
jgi:hypothetical protein